ncbi:multidrug transporter subunit MdtN [Proteus myxofaciens]|uniref:Putative HlyD family secretion protein n=1 Tax=Proteus myxofaciens ATCC 19692 TaxID=1354337 RepID=A0A198FF41_9GAMM|nr:multidrug transporter subunit MdtN [Proteus myxofaciens]OAT22866.1 putative HlyD family secretion protein [Proteus myxofaciens ATCC 19692]
MPLLRKLYSVLLLLITLLVLWIVLWNVNNAPRTDDAYVYADTVSVVPEITGRIIELPVENNQLVKKGDLLYRIDAQMYENDLNYNLAKLSTLDEQIKLAKRSISAQEMNANAIAAQVESARVQYLQSADSYNRKLPLSKKGYVSKDELNLALTKKNSDEATYKSMQLQAQQAILAIDGIEALEAQRQEVSALIEKAKLNIKYTEVRASFDGRVTSLKTTVGQYVSPSQAIMTLIDTSQWFVVANFRETELKGIHEGSKARLFIMSDTGKSFEGIVDSVSYGVAPTQDARTVDGLPSVSRTINWVHVSQRFPVKIRVINPDPNLFRIGASSIAIIYRDK